MSDREESHHSRSASRGKSYSDDGSRHGSESPRRSPSRSRSRSKKRSHRRKRSKSRSRSRSYRRYSRSRSNSRRHYTRSRSRSYDRRRSSRYDHYDDRRSHGSSRRGYYRSRSRSPFSSRRRHMGDRENPTTSRCLGVFGLSLYTQERDIRDLFEKYGPVDEIQVVYDHQTGRSRGFAFVYMRNLDDAVEAKEMAAGAEVDGRKIRVDYSITQRAHTPTPGVYLGKPTPGYSGGSRRSRSPRHGSRRRSRSYSRSYSR